MKGRFFILIPILLHIGYLLFNIHWYWLGGYAIILLIIGYISYWYKYSHTTYCNMSNHEADIYINTFFNDDEIEYFNKSSSSSYSKTKNPPYVDDSDSSIKRYFEALNYNKIWKEDKNLFVKIALVPYFLSKFIGSNINNFLNFLDKHLTI